MKKLLAAAATALLACLTAGQVHAQANAANYSFTTTVTGSLTDMSSGTSTLIAADQDDAASLVTLIGFEFVFMGGRQDRFSVNSNGSLRLGTTVVSTTGYDPLGQSAQALIAPYGADQRTHAGDGKVHYKLIGSAPNRQLVIEWLNMQSNFNAGGTADYTYQVRLSESSGIIEFVYGSMTLSAAGAADPNSQSPQVGFSSSNLSGLIGTVTAAQSGTPAPTFSGAAGTPVNNLYVAGTIPALSSAADGSRRTFTFTPPAVNPPGGPLTFTGVTATNMTLNWTDASNELGYLLYVSSDGINYSFVSTLPQNLTSYAASGLLGSTTYFWRLYSVSEGSTALLAGSQATTTPVANSPLGSGLWSSPATWSTGSVPTSSDAVTIGPGVTVTIDTAGVAYSLNVFGTLEFEQSTAWTLTTASNVTVQAAGTLRSNNAGTQTGHVLSVGGNLINNGTLDFSTNADTAGASITFTGAANATFSGSGGTTDIRTITVNKGSSLTSILEVLPSNFTVRGVTTDTVVGGWLVLTNGTLKLSGNFSGTSRVFSAAGYTIPASAGFWLNNPNYTVAGQNGSPTNNGLLRVSQGTFNIGTATGNSMGFSTGSTIIVEGGSISATGRFGVAAAANAIGYSQSGGIVTVNTIGNTSGTLGSFDLGTSTLSSVSLSGGSIVVQLAATTIDYRHQAGTGIAGVTGTTLQLGNAASGAAKSFFLRGVLPNVVVTNTSAGHSATMSTALVNFNNISRNVTINSGATFNIGNTIFLMAGTTLTNDGTLTANGASSNFTWFDGGLGAQTYTGSGVTTAPITSTSLQHPLPVTMTSSNQWVSGRVNFFGGGFVNGNKVTVGNGAATTAIVQMGVASPTIAITGFDAPPTFNPGTGGVNLLYAPEIAGRTTGNEVPPSRTLNLMSITNTNPVTIAGGDITVNGAAAGALALTAGRVITGANTLNFASTTGTITRAAGYVDGNLQRTLAAAGSVTYDLGTANGYTPVTFNATAGTFPTNVKIAAVQTAAPGIQPTSKAISRYWDITATGVTADVTFSYLDPADIPGTVTEGSLSVVKRESGNPSNYTNEGGSINTGANTATVTGVSTFSTWTLAEAAADVAITITDGVSNVTPGGSVTYTITASNNGTVANPGAVVADTFPAALTCSTTCAGAGGATCTAGPFAGNINDTVNLPSGGSVTYTAVCAISPSATGTLSNTATIASGPVTDPDPANNSATDTNTITPTDVDLAITKTDGVTTATPGGSVTYTITASNAGPGAATGATVADTFPASLTCTWTCVGAGGGTCTASGAGNIADTVNLPSGGSVTYTASCAISASATGTLSNTATVTAPAGVTDTNPANNSATDSDTLTPSANLGITNTDGVTTATAGGSVTYTITASNAGPSNATGATVADTFPASLTCTWTCVGAGGGTCTASGSGNINNTVNLPAGGSVTYTASCAISAAATGTLSNTATVAAPGGVTDPVPGNNSATDTDTLGASADLAITVTDGVTTATPGGSVTYTITASNAGPSNATGATVADTFPASLTCSWTCIGAAGGTCTASGAGNISDTVNLPSGGSVTYSAACTISAGASGTLSNTATVAAPGGVTDPTPGNNSATDTDTLGASADLAITVTDGVTTATPGASVTYIITASNGGPSNATGATVADTFPATLTCTWTCVGAGGGTCTASGSGNIGDTVNLPSGASVTYTASCAISLSATGTLSNTATVTVPGGVTDPQPGNNSATDSDTLGPPPAPLVSGTKTVSGDFTVGGVVTYTIRLTNSGTAAQGDNPGNEMTDVLPPQLLLQSASASSGTAVATVGSNTVTWNGSIAVGETITITIVAAIQGSAGGSAISNQASISYDSDGNGSNDATASTDDPGVAGASNATVFFVANLIPVPTLSGAALVALLLMMAGLALASRRRVAARRGR